MNNEFLWVEKYRPKTIEECILPSDTKKTFAEFVSKGEIPNLLLSGPPGIGKTTVAKALCNELGVDYYVINGSDEGRFLDTVRNNAKNFASTVSLTSDTKHKVIIIDEATTQPTMYNSSLGRLLRSLVATVDSSSPVTTKTESSNRYTVDVPSLISQSPKRTNLQSQHSSLNVSKKSWLQRVLNLITRSW